MLPKVAVVCAAHTELGKQVTRQLIRSPDIAHIYALSEVDIRDDVAIASLPQHLRKLTLLIHPLDFLERTIAASVTEADLAFCCMSSPRHVLPSLGPYLFHKLNFDIPLRFLQQMALLSAHSVALFSHPAASPQARSQFLRVKGELVEAARKFQVDTFPNVPRVVVFQVPILLSDFRRPLQHHATDHIHNGILPPRLSTFDRIKQKAVLKHHADTSAPIHIRDAAYALVADAVHSLDTFVRDEIEQLRSDAQLFVTIDPSAIVELANTARALRKKRISAGANHHAMHDKMSLFAKREFYPRRDSSPQSRPYSPDSRPPISRPQASRKSQTSRAAATPHSVHALGEQISRRLMVVTDNPILSDADRRESLPSDAHRTSHHRGSDTPVRTQSQHERSRRRARDVNFTQGSPRTPPMTPPLASPTRASLESAMSSPPRRFSHASSTKGRRLAANSRKARSFHTPSSPTDGLRRRNRRDRERSISFDQTEAGRSQAGPSRGGVAAAFSAFADKMFAATERPAVRRARETRDAVRRKRVNATADAPSPVFIRGNGDMRAVGETTI